MNMLCLLTYGSLMIRPGSASCFACLCCISLAILQSVVPDGAPQERLLAGIRVNCTYEWVSLTVAQLD